MKFIDDLFFIIGVLLIIGTTFFINVFVACYLLGFLCLLIAGFSANIKNNK